MFIILQELIVKGSAVNAKADQGKDQIGFEKLTDLLAFFHMSLLSRKN
jgi:hypothetical protein